MKYSIRIGRKVVLEAKSGLMERDAAADGLDA
jgi:hypothetical protein